MTDRNPTATPTDALVVDLSALQRHGLGPHPLTVEIPVAWMREILADTDAAILAPGRARLDLTFHGGGGVLVRGRVEITLRVPCARCLEPAQVATSAEVCVNFVPGESTPHAAGGEEEEDVEVDLEAPEELTYSGHHLDLHPLIAEQVAMAYPMRALCALGEACRGLCPSCGANLNDLSAPRCPACRDTLRGAPAPALAAPETPANAAWKAAIKAIRDGRGGDS